MYAEYRSFCFDELSNINLFHNSKKYNAESIPKALPGLLQQANHIAKTLLMCFDKPLGLTINIR